MMNVTFRAPTPELDDAFLKEAAEAGMEQMKGHRVTGGMRASIYNAFPAHGCQALADLMRDFERRKG